MDGFTPLTTQQRALRRLNALRLERSGWEDRWRTICEYILPFSGRFNVNDRNRGSRSFKPVIDTTATYAWNTLAAGMMAGISSPARPWFRVVTPDNDLNEYHSVKTWLAKVSRLMRDIFARGNTYRSLHTLYGELGAFGTAVNVIVPNYDHVIWHHPQTVGQFFLASDYNGRVNTVYRECVMTVEQLVSEFVRQPDGRMDWGVVSTAVRNAWDNHNVDAEFPVLHVIEPRPLGERDLSALSIPKNMPWRSTYILLGRTEDERRVLREGGFQDAPFIAPRWQVDGGDVYGHGPGFIAIGHTLQLQQEQKRKGQAIDYMARPPIALPGEMRARDVNLLPGGVSYFGAPGSAGKPHNLMDVRVDVNALVADINDIRQQINRAFYADLFLLIINDPREQPATAREIAERHEEKMLMLGPVLERLHDEMLSPLIDITFTRLVSAGLLPLPPPELEGMDLRVEFVSTLAQAQRAVGLSSVDRLLGTVGAIAQGSGDMSVWDKVDKDEVLDRYSDMLGVDPQLLVADERVAVIRQQRQAQAAQQQQVEEQVTIAKAQKDMAQAEAVRANARINPLTPFTGY